MFGAVLTQAEVPFDGISDAGTGVAVTVGIDSVCHSIICGRIVQQLICEPDDILCLNTCELDCPSSNRFGALGFLAKNQDRLAQCGRFLLQTAGVGHHEESARHQIVHLFYIDGIDQVDAFVLTQQTSGTFAYDRT